MSNQYVNDFNATVVAYYDDLKKYKPLTKIKEKRLLRLCKKGNIKAQNEIIESNLKFVFDIAKHYTGRGISISDLISEGNLGLIRAIDKFDEEKDVKFISYAVWWIRQAMLEAIKKNKLLKIVEIENAESKVSVLESSIADEEDEIIKRGDKGFSNESDEKSRESSQTQKEIIGRLLNVLNKREREMIENYYGLNDMKELTLAEIGERYNLSVERVRQINKASMKKIRTQMMLFKEFDNLGEILN
jgi:RNA polymerase primary sigma factor